MDVSFARDDLDRLEVDPSFSMGLPPAVVKAYRKQMQLIRSATDTRDLRAMKSGHLEKLKGKRQHQYSMRLNKQFRLVIALSKERGEQKVEIVGVEDYH